MTRSDAAGRIRRMEMLAVQLKQDAHVTIKDLAEAHGVSPRTIARDLALMREQGMQIDADRGRGGGLRLDRNWGVGRLNLSYTEAVDLLISIAVAEQMDSPLFLANLGAVRRQLVASFSPEKRRRVERLKSRILIGVTASTYVQSGVFSPQRQVVSMLHRAFVEQETLEIRYRAEDKTRTDRLIEPHYLMLNYPVWYVLGFDHLRRAPRVFRCDRIIKASPAGGGFALRPRAEFPTVLVNERPES